MSDAIKEIKKKVTKTEEILQDIAKLEPGEVSGLFVGLRIGIALTLLQQIKQILEQE